MTKQTTAAKHSATAPVSILRALISGSAVFIICILLIPFLLTKTDTPEDFISVSAVAIVAFTALASAFGAGFKSGRSFIITGILTSLIIIMLLVCISLMFSKSEDGKNYLFSGILYLVSIVFSLVGAKLAPRNNQKKRKRR